MSKTFSNMHHHLIEKFPPWWPCGVDVPVEALNGVRVCVGGWVLGRCLLAMCVLRCLLSVPCASFCRCSIIRAFLIEEQKIVKAVMRQRTAEAGKSA